MAAKVPTPKTPAIATPLHHHQQQYPGPALFTPSGDANGPTCPLPSGGDSTSSSSDSNSSNNAGGFVGARYQGGVAEERRNVKFVAANTFSHIPNAVAHYATPQPARMSVSHQSLASASVGQQKRGYATFPLSRPQQQQQHQSYHHPQPHPTHHTQQSQHSPSLTYVKEASGSYTFSHTTGGPASAAGKGHVYYNVPYTLSSASRGPKLEFKDRNGFVHNMSYVTTTTTTTTGQGHGTTAGGGPKRPWNGPGSRETATTGDATGVGGGSRDWQQSRQQYAIVSTTMAP